MLANCSLPLSLSLSPSIDVIISWTTLTAKLNEFGVMLPTACAVVAPSTADANVKLDTLLCWTNSSRQNVIRSVAQMARSKRVLCACGGGGE